MQTKLLNDAKILCFIVIHKNLAETKIVALTTRCQ